MNSIKPLWEAASEVTLSGERKRFEEAWNSEEETESRKVTLPEFHKSEESAPCSRPYRQSGKPRHSGLNL